MDQFPPDALYHWSRSSEKSSLIIQPTSFVAVGDNVGDGVQLGRKVFVGKAVRVGRVVGERVDDGINVSVGTDVTVDGCSIIGTTVSVSISWESPGSGASDSPPPPNGSMLQADRTKKTVVKEKAVHDLFLKINIFLTIYFLSRMKLYNKSINEVN
jgi:hypothetical protein